MSTTATGDRMATATVPTASLRALGAVGATAAAVVVWAIAVPGLGTHLLIRFGSGTPQTVTGGLVAGAALLASLCGWGLLAVLERRTRHARAIWTAAAVTVTAASLSLPLIAGTTAATAAALSLMHLAVAGVLIPALRRNPARHGATS